MDQTWGVCMKGGAQNGSFCDAGPRASQRVMRGLGPMWIGIYWFVHSFTGLGQGLEAVGSRADGHPAHWSLESIGEKVESESESC